jgi:2-keto-3-deoxy-L-rhamnonate aldolase RhmA
VNLVFELLVGLAAGGHVSTWGMYKDSIHEGFTVPRYLRSTFVGLFWAPVAARVVGIDATTFGGIVILFGLTYALERATTEFWKTFIRDEDQSKYFIPMQFHVFGHVPRNRVTRLVVGLGYVSLAVGLLQIVRMLQPAPGEQGPLWQLLLVASIGGWYSAGGGAFKDAPIEGFEWFKFFRSPVVATTYGVMISFFTDSYVLIALCGIGYTVATLETYKTFFFPSKPRGKFAGKPILFPDMLQRRQKFVPFYVAIWIGIVFSFTLAFLRLGDEPPAIAGRLGGPVLAVDLAASPVLTAAAETQAPGALIELWSAGTPAFGIFVPDERPEGEREPGGERLPPVYTVQGGARLAANPLYDYVFLNLEGAYDAGAISRIADGLRGGRAATRPTLLVRIPPISADGEDAARARVAEALDNGADGVVLPHVRSPEEARAAVSFFEAANADVWTRDNPDGQVIAMLMIEDAGALAAVEEIANTPGYSVLACGIGSLTRALGDREAGEAGNQEVLRHAERVGLPDMITANADDVARRIAEGFLGLLMSGAEADEHIRVGREAAGR